MQNVRVVITGMGTINAIASDADAFATALQQGRCGIGPLSVFDTAGFRTRTGGEVRAFAPQEWIPPLYYGKRMSRADAMAMVAALEALQDAGLLPLPDGLREDTGVAIGGGAGGMLEGEAAYQHYLAGHADTVRFSDFSAFCGASSADHMASKLQLWGPKTTFMTACSSGATAIGYARDLIRDGMATVMIAGGTEPLARTTYAAFNSLKAVDPRHCKPFDRDRQGMSLGEGAGMLILESLPHALKRGATIYGEVLGYGVSCDANHMTAPDPEASGAVLCMQMALADAGVEQYNCATLMCGLSKTNVQAFAEVPATRRPGAGRPSRNTPSMRSSCRARRLRYREVVEHTGAPLENPCPFRYRLRTSAPDTDRFTPIRLRMRCAGACAGGNSRMLSGRCHHVARRTVGTRCLADYPNAVDREQAVGPVGRGVQTRAGPGMPLRPGSASATGTHPGRARTVCVSGPHADGSRQDERRRPSTAAHATGASQSRGVRHPAPERAELVITATQGRQSATAASFGWFGDRIPRPSVERCSCTGSPAVPIAGPNAAFAPSSEPRTAGPIGVGSRINA